MALTRGVIQPNGVVIGRHGSVHSIRMSNIEALKEVAVALRRQYSLQARLAENTCSAYGPFGRDVRSTTLAATRNGDIIRVINGAGRLIVDGQRDNDMDYGDWAYIPGGHNYALEGSVVRGINLRFVVVKLAS